VRPRVLKDLASFTRLWDRNLKDQRFLDVARAATRVAGCCREQRDRAGEGNRTAPGAARCGARGCFAQRENES